MASTMAEHETFIRQAIQLSRKAAIDYGTGGAFGAVIVKEGWSSPRG